MLLWLFQLHLPALAALPGGNTAIGLAGLSRHGGHTWFALAVVLSIAVLILLPSE
jgi:hypothetical protein